MSGKRKDFSVNILGRDYEVGGALDPAYVEQLAEKVDGMLHALDEASPGQENEQLAVLTALNLADQIKQLTDQLEQLKEEKQDPLPPPTAPSPAPQFEPLPPDLNPRIGRCIQLLEDALQENSK